MIFIFILSASICIILQKKSFTFAEPIEKIADYVFI